MKQTNDLRIRSVDPLISPRLLKEELPMTEASNTTVVEGRAAIEAIIAGEDPRLLAIVGPCSIHDPAAAIEYAERLERLRRELSDRLYVVMRVYFEKPRTRLGWRGLILDPRLDGSYEIQTGLRTARRILLDITERGLPVGSEMLDPIVPQYTSDLLSWASIGARTTESQTHREMASGLSMPIGYKNGTDGDVDVAINALSSARSGHSFIGIDSDGRTCVLHTTGNTAGHIILRGGRGGPNYHEEDVEAALEGLDRAGFNRAIVVDCSHANSQKNPEKQLRVLSSVVRQRCDGERALIGFMLESNLLGGRQEIQADLGTLRYGVSVTDACVGWEETEAALRDAHARLGACG